MTQATLSGFDLRDSALNLLERTRADWILRARGVAHNIILRKGWVTADDLREVWPVPDGWDCRVVGAVFRDRRFLKIGTTVTERVTSHGRPISVFRLR
jgi:hypothetical protein